VAVAGWHAGYADPLDRACRSYAPNCPATESPGNRIARVFLCLDGGVLVALHAFIKKTRKTPDDELAVARKRQKELKS